MANYETTASEVRPEYTSAIVDESVDGTTPKHVVSQFIETGKEHPVRDGDHSDEAAGPREIEITDHEARVEITLTALVFSANKGFEIRRIKLGAHIRRIRHHDIEPALCEDFSKFDCPIEADHAAAARDALETSYAAINGDVQPLSAGVSWNQ